MFIFDCNADTNTDAKILSVKPAKAWSSTLVSSNASWPLNIMSCYLDRLNPWSLIV